MRFFSLFFLVGLAFSSFAISEELYGTWNYESLILENNDELKSSEEGRKGLKIIHDEFSNLQLSIHKNGNFQFRMKEINDFGTWKIDNQKGELILSSRITGISYYGLIEVGTNNLVLGIEGGRVNFVRSIEGNNTTSNTNHSISSENKKICKKQLSQKWQLVEYLWANNGKRSELSEKIVHPVICKFEKDGSFVFNAVGEIIRGKWLLNKGKRSFVTQNPSGESSTWFVKGYKKNKLIIHLKEDNKYWVLKRN